MREQEVEYWDKVANLTINNGGISDNWMKRHFLAQFLLRCHWERQTVLEIGTGNGLTAALLSMSCGRRWSYIGTDLSPVFAAHAARFGLDVVQADVLSLPPGQFTRILALDSLEHVHPGDRPEGYKAIAERLAPGGLLFINMPLAESQHEDGFDHGIGLTDLVALEERGLALTRYELYAVQLQNQRRNYGFAVMTKEIVQ